MSSTAKIVLSVVGIVIIGSFFYFIPHIPTSTDYIKENVDAKVKWIFLDAKTYEILWMRWTVVDWFLGLLAAGTAITAAIKNAFTAHNNTDPNDPTSRKIDKVVMIFAVLTVVATTLDGKMHAAQNAERFRQGDLLLQDEIMKFRMSDEGDKAKADLLNAWLQAQRILEGAPSVTPGPGTGTINDTIPVKTGQPSPPRPETTPPAPTSSTPNTATKDRTKPY